MDWFVTGLRVDEISDTHLFPWRSSVKNRDGQVVLCTIKKTSKEKVGSARQGFDEVTNYNYIMLIDNIHQGSKHFQWNFTKNHYHI
jgi:hypothetical protein